MRRWIPLVACLALGACASSDQKPKDSGQPGEVEVAPIEKRTPDVPPGPPRGYIRMSPFGVAPTGQGNAVLLVDGDNEKILPIFIGDTEAMAIQLRLDGRPFQRPLTHDLLDSVVKELGGKIVKVHVDELRAGTFIGTLFVWNGTRVIEIDARPSDCIALAVGNDAPIYVAKTVVDLAGLNRSDLENIDAPPPDGGLPIDPTKTTPL